VIDARFRLSADRAPAGSQKKLDAVACILNNAGDCRARALGQDRREQSTLTVECPPKKGTATGSGVWVALVFLKAETLRKSRGENILCVVNVNGLQL